MDELRKSQNPKFDQKIEEIQIQLNIPIISVPDKIDTHRESIVSIIKDEEDYESMFLKKNENPPEEEVKEDSVTSSDLELDAITEVER